MTSKINWADLENQENLVFLHSGTDAGEKSLLAWDLKKEFTHPQQLSQNKLFGFIGYGYRNKLEDLPKDKPTYIELPDFWFGEFNKTTSIPTNELPTFAEPQTTPQIKSINSNMSDSQYLEKAQDIINRIKAGDVYEANLTRKFFGEFAAKPNPFSIFCKLSQISPAQYSAYIKLGNKHIICASPERFLKIENGKVTTSPIKGTMPLSKTAEDLANSEKDKAENLMIVDLMRNDLSKTCDNVKVEELFKVITHKKYHHMHSTITADAKQSAIDIVLGCFPPGSMTGAPKIKAIEICSELETIERGLYSGSIGWINKNDCDLNVVIRTIIIEDNKFEFQAGGAIVADSSPETELEEINVKLKAIREVLQIP